MNTENKTHMKNDGAWKAVNEAFSPEVPEYLERRFQETLKGFRRDLRVHPYVLNHKQHGFPLIRKLFSFSRHRGRPFLLAGMGLALIIIAGFFLLGNEPPTWAEVAESFRRTESYYATFYIKSCDWRNPTRVELWGGYGGRFRMISGDTVAFGANDEYLKVFNIKSRTEGNPNAEMQMVLRDVYEVIKTEDGFIESFFKTHSDGNVVDTTALVYPDPIFSKDLIVMDAMSPGNYVSIRLWALRESRLPVRIRSICRGLAWFYIDAIFSYPKAQPEKFFDPEAFAAEMKKPHHMEYDLMYLFMEDPVKTQS